MGTRIIILLVHSKDEEDYGGKPKISHTKMMMGQHWLGKTKSKNLSDRPKTLSKSCYGI